MAGETSGFVKVGEFHQELKELRGDLTKIMIMLTEYHGEVKQAGIDRANLKKALDILTTWREETDDRLDALESKDRRFKTTLESKDKRFIAGIGAIGVAVGAVITGIVNIILAVMKS